jgi:hypothetical protein
MARSIKKGYLSNGNRHHKDLSVRSYYSKEDGVVRKMFRRKTRRQGSELVQSMDVEELADEPMPIARNTEGWLSH